MGCQGAYYFFEAAKNIVKAADEDTADKYTLAQAEVVRPLAEGMKTKIGNSELDNRPMTVSDEIIKAGIAPNSYWMRYQVMLLSMITVLP